MNSKIKVLIISLKNSPRIFHLTKRLNYLKIKYKIIEAISGNEAINKKNINLLYNKKDTLDNIGRELSAPEIGCAASHLKAYKFIIKNKIDSAIIMEDDAYPSLFLKKWINANVKINNNDILSFFSNPSGFLRKKPFKTELKNKIKIHIAKTHIYSCGCYQINNFTCKKIISITQGKVVGIPDWPFNIKKNKINLLITLPFLAIINDRGFSYLKEAREKILENKTCIKKFIPDFLYKLFSPLYYLSYIPYLISKKKSWSFYNEHFAYKAFLNIKNLIVEKDINVKDIFYDINNYTNDLKKDFLKYIKKS